MAIQHVEAQQDPNQERLSGGAEQMSTRDAFPAQHLPRYFTEKDWAEQREIISTMYARDDKSLQAIRRFMAEDRKLLAS